MIVITLSCCPPSLRGDLTKWFHEVSTNVFVGRASSRIREEIWKRIIETIKDGSATMIFSTNNEQGFGILTNCKTREVEDFDGLLLVSRLKRKPNEKEGGN